MSKYAVAAIALLSVVGFGLWRWTPATFTVKNESGQLIQTLIVEVAGKTYSFEGIPPGGEVSGSFPVEQEESLLVRGRLADGAEFGEWCGYVVWEVFAPHFTAVVRREGLIGTL